MLGGEWHDKSFLGKNQLDKVFQKFQENCQKLAFCKIGNKSDSYVLELIDCVVNCIVLVK